ncbi:NCS2 family permease [Oceanobacillus saliphilus]|uniref:NCS2 family permease n=1 Tax=Oceanobacillus saliphilus TaxID=2925834 RepID=UPI00201D83EA|nr:NCS2 family permease [Oceanobacillus saliphilus]
MNKNILNQMFQIQNENTTIRTEILAGITSFVTVSYIVIVNGTVLNLAGMPYEAVTIATVLVSFLGCMLMAFWANSPLILIPGMGDNAFFVFTLVFSLGLTWEQSLVAVLFAGIAFVIISFTKLADYLSHAVPVSLIYAITAGIGLFVAFLGFKNGGIIVSQEDSFVQLATLGDRMALTSILTLIVMLFLIIKKVKGNILIGIIVGTIIGILLGITDISSLSQFEISFDGYESVFFAYDFSAMNDFNFWIGVFSLTMVVLFQNMGAQLSMLPNKSKFKKSYQANAFSIVGASLFGSSSTATTAESATGISLGGKTGLTSFTAGILFIPTLFFIPILTVIPLSAIAPVLIIVGFLMFQSAVEEIPFNDLTEAIPAFLMITVMPFSLNIPNGIGFGFISYVLLKLFTGKKEELNKTMYVIAFLFLIYFFLY